MSRRTTEAYFNALYYINDKLISLKGISIIIDFERAMRLALIQLGIVKDILGCWFHSCQAIRRRMASMVELFKLVRSKQNVYSIFRQFQCLALLPPEKIEGAFLELSREALKVTPLFADFIDYFNREWIGIVKPVHFSVFMRGTRTTAGAEASNGQINKRFKANGTFFHFCESMQNEEVVIAQQLENDLDGTIQRENQTPFYKRRNKLINKYSIQLKNGDIEPMHLLRIMANHKNNILYGESDTSQNAAEVRISVETELYGGSDNVIYNELDECDLSDLSDLEIDIDSNDIERLGTSTGR